MVADCIIIITA